MMRVILGSSKVVLIRLDFWRWAKVRSCNCDMYWPLSNMYWERSGFGLGGFILGGFCTRGKGLDMYMYIHRYIHIHLYFYPLCRILCPSCLDQTPGPSTLVVYTL